MQSEASKLKENLKTYAMEAGIRLNPDKKKVDEIIKGLYKNKAKYGKLYCPCRPVIGNEAKDNPKICPCKWHREEIKRDGQCLCGLFVEEK